MLEKFLKEELADKYELFWYYDFRTDSIVIEMRDGFSKQNPVISMREIMSLGQVNREFIMVETLRAMMRQIDECKERFVKEDRK